MSLAPGYQRRQRRKRPHVVLLAERTAIRLLQAHLRTPIAASASRSTNPMRESSEVQTPT